MKYKTFDEYVKRIHEISDNPLTYGVHLATGGDKPMGKNLEAYLNECYKSGITPEQALFEWI